MPTEHQPAIVAMRRTTRTGVFRCRWEVWWAEPLMVRMPSGAPEFFFPSKIGATGVAPSRWQADLVAGSWLRARCREFTITNYTDRSSS